MRRKEEVARPTVSPGEARSATVDATMEERFSAEVVSQGNFSEQWFLPFIETWELFLLPLVGVAAQVLEIGSYEGLSTCYLLWRLRDARITCVDTFRGGLEYEGDGERFTDLEAVFDANVALVGADRTRKIVGDSRAALLTLQEHGEEFDLVYVDGSHLGLVVIVDAVTSWQMLKEGGVLVFDDYRWAAIGDDPLLRPGPAIDAFLTLIEGKYELLHMGRQLAIRKHLSASA